MPVPCRDRSNMGCCPTLMPVPWRDMLSNIGGGMCIMLAMPRRRRAPPPANVQSVLLCGQNLVPTGVSRETTCGRMCASARAFNPCLHFRPERPSAATVAARQPQWQPLPLSLRLALSRCTQSEFPCKAMGGHRCGMPRSKRSPFQWRG